MNERERKEVIIHLLSEFDSFECAKALAHCRVAPGSSVAVRTQARMALTNVYTVRVAYLPRQSGSRRVSN